MNEEDNRDKHHVDDHAERHKLEEPLAIVNVVLVHADEDVEQGGDGGDGEAAPILRESQGECAEDLEDAEDVGGRGERAAAAR